MSVTDEQYEDLKTRLAEALVRAMDYVKERNEAWEQLAVARAELTLDEGGEIRGYATEELNEYGRKLRKTAIAARAKVAAEADAKARVDERWKMMNENGLVVSAVRDAEAKVIDAFDKAFNACVPYTLGVGPTVEDFKRSREGVLRKFGLKVAHEMRAGIGNEGRSDAQVVEKVLRDTECPVASSITGQPCLLPEGHPADSPNRFHRYEERSK